MNIVGVGRLAQICVDAARERRLSAWLAELREARLLDMTDVIKRFASAKPKSATAADFALSDGLIVETLFSFTACTMLIRSARNVPQAGA
jgi:hypothetical protein